VLIGFHVGAEIGGLFRRSDHCFRLLGAGGWVFSLAAKAGFRFTTGTWHFLISSPAHTEPRLTLSLCQFTVAPEFSINCEIALNGDTGLRQAVQSVSGLI
jgi:hypothetical protein